MNGIWLMIILGLLLIVTWKKHTSVTYYWNEYLSHEQNTKSFFAFMGQYTLWKWAIWWRRKINFTTHWKSQTARANIFLCLHPHTSITTRFLHRVILTLECQGRFVTHKTYINKKETEDQLKGLRYVSIQLNGET